MARKVTADGYDALQCRMTEYSRESAAQKLAQIAGGNLKDFTAESFAARAAPIMTSLVNEGFFADVVVVVEGVSDAAILWAMQSILDKKWDELGIVIVPAGGKNNIDRPVVVFSGLGIPCHFIFDGDNRYAGKDEERNAIRSNKILLQLANVKVEDFPKTQSEKLFSVFSDELETEIKNINKEKYDAISIRVASDIGHNKPSTLFKNPHAAELFIKQFYDEGQRVPILEEMVNNITSLRNM